MSGRGERGLTESLQWAVLWPVVMLLVLGTIQLGVWWHAHLTLAAAAATAADLSTLEQAAPAAAREAAIDVAASGGVEAVDVDVSRGPRDVEVVVTGRAPLIIDLGLGTIRATATAPLEVAR